MDKEKLLIQFKQQNKKLFELSHKVIISGLEEDWNSNTNEVIVHDPPIYQIEVWRPFVFDVRLIPAEFNGIKVVDQFVGSYPSEFPSDNAALPLEEFEAPERYIKFVNNNLGLISKTLLLPNLTRDEALNALTGDFNKHINWCVNMRASRIKEEKDNIAFFNELLYETKQAYALSDIAFKNEDWYYSITATKFSKNKPLIVGFNWGAEANYKYTPQYEYPFATFSGIYDDLGSLKRTMPFFYAYYTHAVTGMQTNYCFFRSQEEKQISNRDIELSRPLFEKYLDYVDPSTMISFSSKLRDYFIEKGLITERKSLYIRYIKGKTEVVKAKYVLNSGKIIDFVYIPHPMARISNEDRDRAWEFCFNLNSVRKT